MTSNQKPPVIEKSVPKPAPGDGNIVVMGIGLICITGVFGYIAYMRAKYEKAGYYAAVQDGGKEVFLKKQSKWDS